MFTLFSSEKSDYLGIFASIICAIHCAITPLIFMAKPLLQHASTDTTISCADAPIAWRLFDFVFLFIGLFAIKYSIKFNTKASIRGLLCFSWVLLAFGVLGASKFGHGIMYAGSIGLVGSHIWNIYNCKSC